MSKKTNKPLGNVGVYADNLQTMSNIYYGENKIQGEPAPIANLYLLLWLSNYAYRNKAPVDRLRGMGVKKWKLFSDKQTDAQVWIYYDEKTVVLAGRGTELKRKDILTDLLFIKKWTKYGRTSVGFTRACDSLKDKIFGYLVNNNLLDHEYYLTGHSAGSSIIQLLSVRIKKDLGINPYVYSFEGTKVGGILFRRLVRKLGLKKRSILTIFNNDPVPRLPFRWSLIWHFVHAFNILYITHDYKAILNPRKITRIRDRIVGAFKDIGDKHVDGLNDHKCDEVIMALGNIMTKGRISKNNV